MPVATGRPPRGGRGLKYQPRGGCNRDFGSPPSRGAWIEILNTLVYFIMTLRVAPLAGGVD